MTRFVLGTFEILGLFFNPITADDKISCRNGDNFVQQIQMQISTQPKPFPQFFFVLLKSISNFEYFEKKEDSHSLSISRIIDYERGCYLNV